MSIEDRTRQILGLDRPEQEPRRLSMRVEQLWRAEGFAPVVPFNGSFFSPLGPSVDIAILQESLAAVMRRHDVLHSRLAISGNHPVLVIEELKEPDLAVTKVTRAQIAAHREGEPSIRCRSEFVADAPINLLSESGFRCRAFRDEDGNVTLGVLLHHYFGDGWSSQILRREISTAYAAMAQGNVLQLNETLQYADYALSQRQSLAASLSGRLGYWQKRLENAPSYKLPYDHVADTGKMGRLYFGIGEELAAGLAAISQSLRVSIFIIYLAALQMLLARWCGERKSHYGGQHRWSRVKPQFLNIVGYLIASVPVYTEIQDDWTLNDLLSSIAKSFYDAYGHRDLSYDPAL